MTVVQKNNFYARLTVHDTSKYTKIHVFDVKHYLSQTETYTNIRSKENTIRLIEYHDDLVYNNYSITYSKHYHENTDTVCNTVP